MSTEFELSPERRFRLYMRIAGLFEEAEMHEAATACVKIATKAARESPAIQAELQRFLDKLSEEARRE